MRTFSLESVLMITTLIAVCLGLGTLGPVWGILLAVISAPAVMRTIGVRTRRKIAGKPMGLYDKASVFLASVALVYAIGIATAATFGLVGVACAFVLVALLKTPPTESVYVFLAFFVASLYSSLGVAGFLIYHFWRRTA